MRNVKKKNQINFFFIKDFQGHFNNDILQIYRIKKQMCQMII